MSGGAKIGASRPHYDAPELRRRMAVGFTIGELYRLADKLQVPQTPAWSNNPQEAARDIVRHFEQSGVLAFLVDALREAKPLVEWPEPAAAQPATSAPVASAPVTSAPVASAPVASAPVGPTLAAAPADIALEYADTALEPPPGDRPTPVSTMIAADILAHSSVDTGQVRTRPGPTLGGGFAPAVMPRPGEAPPLAPVQATAPLQATRPQATPAVAGTATTTQRPSPPPPDRPTVPVWPGMAVASPEPSLLRKLLAPKVLIGAGAAALVGVILLAFFVGRASSSPGSGSAEGSSSTTGAAPSDQAEVAVHVIDVLGSSLERVAKACQIEPSQLRGRSLFEVAYERCGVVPESVVHVRPRSTANAQAAPGNPPLPPDADPPPQGKPAKPGGNNKLQKVDSGSGAPGAGGSSCISACSRGRSACQSKCGAEPKQSSQYDAYMACQSGCMKAAAQCNMGCN